MNNSHDLFFKSILLQVTFRRFAQTELSQFFKAFDAALGNSPNLGDTDRDIRTRIISYIFAHTDIPPQAVWDDLNHTTENMSTLEQFIALGRAEGITLGKQEGISLGKQEGKEEGKAEGKRLSAKIIKLHQKGYTAAAIAKELQTTIAEVQEVVEEYERD